MPGLAGAQPLIGCPPPPHGFLAPLPLLAPRLPAPHAVPWPHHVALQPAPLLLPAYKSLFVSSTCTPKQNVFCDATPTCG